MTKRTASIIGGIGRTLIALGFVTLSFAAFQLWGTGLQEARAQKQLENDFEERLASVQALSSATTTPTQSPSTTMPENVSDAAEEPMTSTTLDAELVALMNADEGSVLGSINIPSIDLERHIVEGIQRDNLRDGPGHYPTSPQPGQQGNAAIAGHRTTYGSPFGDLDLLLPGDEIIVTTLQGEFRYEVTTQTNEDGDDLGHFIVDPSQVEILEDYGDNRLTLTACHPKYTARQRIVVTALLVEEPAPVIPKLVLPEAEDVSTSTDPVDELGLDEGNVVGISENALDESLGWNYEERAPTIAWGLMAFLIVAIALVAGRLWKRLPCYVVATPGFLMALFICFTHLDRLLPAL